MQFLKSRVLSFTYLRLWKSKAGKCSPKRIQIVATEKIPVAIPADSIARSRKISERSFAVSVDVEAICAICD